MDMEHIKVTNMYFTVHPIWILHDRYRYYMASLLVRMQVALRFGIFGGL